MHRLVSFSLHNRVLIGMLWALLAVLGIGAMMTLPIDAVPDITPNQVIVLTPGPGLSPVEVEKFLTYPVEMAMSGVPGVTNVFSISRYGFSYVAIYFNDDMEVFFCRQLVMERLSRARELMPPEYGPPELAPVSTGLGEIYHFKVTGKDLSLMELRSILDWDIAPKLRTVPGIVDVNAHGGELKTYEVQVDNDKLLAHGVTLQRLLKAVEENNANAGGAYLVRSQQQLLIRGEGLIDELSEVGDIVVGASAHGVPIYVRSVANVRFAPMVRQGVATQDGEGEVVVGIAMMLIGENSRVVVDRVKERISQIQQTLPPGVRIEPFYDRTELIRSTIRTVFTNLSEGAFLVIGVLFVLLGNWSGSLIVSLAIPLSMLCAFIGMKWLGVSGNLMSLGAIDFGLIVEASVFMTETILRKLVHRPPGETVPHSIRSAAEEVTRPMVFGVLIIILVYVPVLTLGGVEGKMVKPMAITVILALSSSLFLALTLTPVLASIAFRSHAYEKDPPLMRAFQRIYYPLLDRTLSAPRMTMAVSVAFFLIALTAAPFLGAEFLPRLEEGSVVVTAVRGPGVSVEESVRANLVMEHILRSYPDVATVISRTGRPEVAMDPAGLEVSDAYVMLKPAARRNKEALVTGMRERLAAELPNATYSFTQPIEMRMQELMAAGLRSDVGVKIYGDDFSILRAKADQIRQVLSTLPGAADLRVEAVSGLPYLRIRVKRDEIARYGINVRDVLDTVESLGGKPVGQVVEGERRYSLQVRLAAVNRSTVEAIREVKVADPGGHYIPLAQLAEIIEESGPNQISREASKRRISVEVNVRGRDLASFVRDAQNAIQQRVNLPPGYWMEWGGQFRQFESALGRLAIAVPATLLMIFFLLYLNSHSVKQALLIYSNIPMAATGGILALYFTGTPFSISAGVGFIALFGIAVLNAVVLVNFITRLRSSGMDLAEAVRTGARTQLRPILMTALVAGLGFIPMALATGAGAEVQRPLAIVVIGGLIPSTFLTVLTIPSAYRQLFRQPEQPEEE